MSVASQRHEDDMEATLPTTPPLQAQTSDDADVNDLIRLVSTMSIQNDLPGLPNPQTLESNSIPKSVDEIESKTEIHAPESVQREPDTKTTGSPRSPKGQQRARSSRRAVQEFGANSPDYPASVSKETANMTGIFFDERCLLHQANYGHFECPERLAESYKLLVEDGVWSRCVQFRLMGRKYPTADDVVTPETQTSSQGNPEAHPLFSMTSEAIEEANSEVTLATARFPIPPLTQHPLSFPPVPLLPLETIMKTHDATQVQRVEISTTYDYKDPEPDSETEGDAKLYPDCKFLDQDTYVNQYSAMAARIAATAATEVTRRVLRGELKNGFSLTRPPGHHASSRSSSGFCLYNNVVVAAQAALREFPETCRRIMIIDFDVHHGDGTQECFWDSREVLFVSVHRFGGNFFPGTGTAKQIGGDAAKGYTVNVPLVGTAGDIEYMHIWRRLILPLLAAHAPHLVFLSAGFDCLAGDPLGEMKVTPLGIGHLVRMTREALPPECGLVGVLEGGYNPQAVAEGVKWVMKAMLGDELPKLPPDTAFEGLAPREASKLQALRDRHIQSIEQVCEIHKKYWPVLKL